jgi:hypothetical protein
MHCNRCSQILRQDEQLVHIQDCQPTGPTVLHTVCPACAAEMQGGKYQPVKYPVGTRPPAGVEVCGVCRLAYRHGEQTTLMRLQSEDLEGTPFSQPGMFASCGDCVRLFTPIIFERHRAAGRLTHISQMTEGWLG